MDLGLEVAAALGGRRRRPARPPGPPPAEEVGEDVADAAAEAAATAALTEGARVEAATGAKIPPPVVLLALLGSERIE